MSAPRSRRNAVLVVALALTVSACLVAGCGKGSSVGAARGGSGSVQKDTVTGQELLQKGSVCTENREVREPAADSAEWVIWRLYELALGPDDAAGFDAFAALFPAQRNRRQLKEMYWPRIRKNVDKYLLEDGEPAYRICRLLATDQGTKFFIASRDPRQYPPPITIGKVGEEWKVMFFTPF